MAKSKSTSKNISAQNFKSKELSFSFLRKAFTFIDVHMRKIVGLLLLILCVFFGVAFVSYLFTWKADQSLLLNHNQLFSFLLSEESAPLNHAGKLGAYLSHQFIYEGFGIMSFLFIPFLGIWGLNFLLRERLYSTLRTFFYTSLLILLASPVLTFFIPKHIHTFPFGGAFGELINFHLMTQVGKIGTTILMIGLGLLAAIIFFSPIFKLPLWQRLFANRNDTTSTVTDNSEQVAKISVDEEQGIIEVAEENYVSGPTLDELIAEQNQPVEQEIELQIETEPRPNEIIQSTEEKMEIENPPALELEIETTPTEIELEPTPSITNETPMASSPSSDLDFTIEVAKTEEDIEASNTSGITVATDEPYDPSLELRNYKFPTIDLLEQRSTEEISIDKNELEQNKNQIINTLKSFGIAIAKISATVGPTVTLYEIVPAEGVRISKIRNLEDDIALSLSALGIRIIAPIPGKGTIGIEVPNLKKQFVSMRTLLASEKFIHNDFSLPIALGKRIDNENYIVDLAKMPHLLMAGATGQGKSVGINTILVSLLYKKHPSQLKFVMVDPKKVELSIYKHIEKHFLAKLPNEEDAIITDTKKVINTLNALCIEMDNRYDLLKDAGVRNIREYNEKFIKRKLLPTKGHKYLPFIVLVVDEFADLIMTAGKEVEMPIARIAQLARAVGIHCIVATQRPSVNVITGTIKANFPGRVAFKVSAKVDSRTILDSGGAEQLIGQGDMLILNGSELVRIQCAFVDTPEVERIVEFIGNQQGYPTAFDLPEYEGADGGDLASAGTKSLKEVDQMFEQCARLVVTSGSGSTSMLQRRFNLGYNRAGRIMDQLEAAGIVGASIGGKPRELLVHTETELDEVLQAIGKL